MVKHLDKPKPKLYIIGGPNGAGKTTFANRFIPQFTECQHFVNADLIARGLSPFAPEVAMLQAGRLVLEKIKQLSSQQVDFALESTMSGRSYASLFKQLKSQGYEIHMFYIWVPDVKATLLRIKDRVRLGGHNVPEADVLRRFDRSVSNFFQLYRPLADAWTIIINREVEPEKIAYMEHGEIYVLNSAEYNKMTERI